MGAAAIVVIQSAAYFVVHALVIMRDDQYLAPIVFWRMPPISAYSCSS